MTPDRLFHEGGMLFSSSSSILEYLIHVKCEYKGLRGEFVEIGSEC